MVGGLSCFLVLLATATKLLAAPAEPLQQPVELLCLEEWLDQSFDTLADYGISPFINYSGAFQGNPVGGIQQQTAYSHSLVFGATLNFDKLHWIKGGSLIVSGAEATGKSLSNEIGNINNVSAPYVTPLTVLFYQMYWKEILYDELELRLGRMVAGDQFASLPAFALQVNGGINTNPTSIFANAPFTISPNATWATSAKFKPTNQKIYAEAGIYEASKRLPRLGYHGLYFSMRPDDGELLLGQVGWDSSDNSGDKSSEKCTQKLTGTYILGGYYSNFSFPELNGSNIQHNAYGFYAMGQQMLCQSAADLCTNFSVWGGLTFAPQQDISLLPLMGFAGTIWRGVVRGRDRDQLLLTYLASGLSRNYADSVVEYGGKRPTAEHVLEASYQIWVNKYYKVQPDIQYIIRPKGAGNIRDALVIGIQFLATFGEQPE
jgi:porin